MSGQVDAVEAAETRAIVEAEASKIATDNADGLGEERRNAVLAEAEAAAAQGDYKNAIRAVNLAHNLLPSRSVLGRHGEVCIESCAYWWSAGGKTLKSKLARSGHTANLIGTRVVITGGILRDGSLYVDIVAVNLATLEVSRWVAPLRSIFEVIIAHMHWCAPQLAHDCLPKHVQEK